MQPVFFYTKWGRVKTNKRFQKYSLKRILRNFFYNCWSSCQTFFIFIIPIYHYNMHKKTLQISKGCQNRIRLIQSTKIFLLPPKYEIIMLPCNHSFFQYWTFLFCSPFSYRSSNCCDIKSYRSFTLLTALAKSNGNLIAIVFKSEKERQLSLSR